MYFMCVAAGVGWHEEDEVDYDLDEQDRQWLTAFNHGQERLPYRRMELLLWRLDTANAEATDSAFASEPLLQLMTQMILNSPLCSSSCGLILLLLLCLFCRHLQRRHMLAVQGVTTTICMCPHHGRCFCAGAGASVAERTSPAACATTDHMSREQAMEALTQVAAARQPVKDAVYRYWLDKRKQLGKPLLRRLQAPTNSSDTNPHSCFRCSRSPLYKCAVLYLPSQS